MLRVTGIDYGQSETRAISLGLWWGAPRRLTPSTGPVPGALVAMPSSELTIRTLNVPESSREVQQNVIREELALSLPFPLEEVSWDWIESEGNATVIVVPNASLARLEERAGPEATIEAAPLSLLRLVLSQGVKEALVFDCGATQTTVCAVKDGSLSWVKVSFRGGRSLTQAISRHYELGEEEAERRKWERGLEEPLCRQWLDSILEASLLSKPLPWERIFICGGAAQMRGLRSHLEESLGVPVQPFELPGDLHPYQEALAYGTALAGLSKYPHIQLVERVEEGDALPWKYALGLGVLLLLGSVNLELHHFTAQRSVTQQIEVYQQAVGKELPALAKSDPETFQSELNKRASANWHNQRCAPEYLLETMARLARPLSKQPQLEVRRLELEAEGEVPRLTIGGQAGSVRQVEEFRQGAQGILLNPQLVENKPGRQNMVTFTLEGDLPTL